jgi:hypothetical protein
MNRRAMALVAAGIATCVWVGVSAQQEMLSRPGPGSGVTPVRVVDEPVVRLTRGSEVRVVDTISVSVRAPSFVVKGRTLEITWATGDEERVTVGEVIDGGWVEVGSPGAGSRYVNLGSARAVRIAR